MDITQENIEALLLDYIEGNLSDKKAKELEDYIALHPQYKQMADLYDPMLKYPVPSDIVFEQKEKLKYSLMPQRCTKIAFIGRYAKFISGIAALLCLVFVLKMVLNINQTALQDNQIAKHQIEDTVKESEPAVLAYGQPLQKNKKVRTYHKQAFNTAVTATENNQTDELQNQTVVYAEKEAEGLSENNVLPQQRAETNLLNIVSPLFADGLAEDKEELEYQTIILSNRKEEKHRKANLLMFVKSVFEGVNIAKK